jgi:integrase
MYVRAHLLPFFGNFETFTPTNYGDYMRERIQQVSRSTLRKELSGLRQFRSWCEEQGFGDLPPVPGLPKHGHPGKRHKQGRKRPATILSPAEVARILACVSEPVRPFFTLCWETGLRPYSTILKLETPLHYKKGAKTLFISREIDKRAFERTIPLTPEASEVLDGLCPKDGGRLFKEDSPRAFYLLAQPCRESGEYRQGRERLRFSALSD